MSRTRATAWLTLGAEPGTVQVWLSPPVLRDGAWELPEGAAHLLVSGEGPVSAKFAAMPWDEALKEFRTLPETRRELVRVEGDAALRPVPAGIQPS